LLAWVSRLVEYHKRKFEISFETFSSLTGHELTHAFDSISSDFDGEGTLSHWWNNESKVLMAEKSQCLIEQFDNFTDVLTSKALDGTRNLNENLADNGSLDFQFET
jgi:predicted metalloendopeptidase